MITLLLKVTLTSVRTHRSRGVLSRPVSSLTIVRSRRLLTCWVKRPVRPWHLISTAVCVLCLWRLRVTVCVRLGRSTTFRLYGPTSTCARLLIRRRLRLIVSVVIMNVLLIRHLRTRWCARLRYRLIRVYALVSWRNRVLKRCTIRSRKSRFNRRVLAARLRIRCRRIPLIVDGLYAMVD